MLGCRLADGADRVALGEGGIERPAGADRGFAPLPGIVFGNPLADHLDEHVERHRAAAVIFRLGHRAVADIGAGEARVLGEVARQVAERALDGLALPGIRRRPMDLHPKLGENAHRVFIADFETEPVAHPGGQPFGGEGPAVIEVAMIGDAELVDHVAEGQPHALLVFRPVDAPGQELSGVKVLECDHQRPADGAVRPFHEHIPLVPVRVHGFERMEHAAVARLRRIHPLQRIHALAGHNLHRGRQRQQPALQRARRRQRPAALGRRRHQPAITGGERWPLQPQPVGAQHVPRLVAAFCLAPATNVLGRQ